MHFSCCNCCDMHTQQLAVTINSPPLSICRAARAADQPPKHLSLPVPRTDPVHGSKRVGHQVGWQRWTGFCLWISTTGGHWPEVNYPDIDWIHLLLLFFLTTLQSMSLIPLYFLDVPIHKFTRKEVHCSRPFLMVLASIFFVRAGRISTFVGMYKGTPRLGCGTSYKKKCMHVPICIFIKKEVNSP